MKQAGSGFYFLYGVKAYYLSLSEIANSNRGDDTVDTPRERMYINIFVKDVLYIND